MLRSTIYSGLCPALRRAAYLHCSSTRPTTRITPPPPLKTIRTFTMASPKIIFYTNPTCPWAHRGYIALKELGLPYEEIVIDLETPREPWYLEVNPVRLITLFFLKEQS
jgi:glutathionyl-hydroquinone reductase